MVSLLVQLLMHALHWSSQSHAPRPWLREERGETPPDQRGAEPPLRYAPTIQPVEAERRQGIGSLLDSWLVWGGAIGLAVLLAVFVTWRAAEGERRRAEQAAAAQQDQLQRRAGYVALAAEELRERFDITLLPGADAEVGWSSQAGMIVVVNGEGECEGRRGPVMAIFLAPGEAIRLQDPKVSELSLERVAFHDEIYWSVENSRLDAPPPGLGTPVERVDRRKQ